MAWFTQYLNRTTLGTLSGALAATAGIGKPLRVPPLSSPIESPKTTPEKKPHRAWRTTSHRVFVKMG